jgi:hypothetical protein
MCVKAYLLIFSKKSQRLIDENNRYQVTSGVSGGNREYNFIPAFLDFESGVVYISSFSNGVPAPIHIYEGLPSHLIISRNAINKTVKIKHSVVSGFIHENQFYTRDQAMNVIAGFDKKH